MAAIGIMGGTFNPIHIGHIEIAGAAYKQFSLDEVWFMPNHIPAYKSDKDLVSGKDRLAMVELAITDIPYFKSSDFEWKREGHTYTAETFTLLHDRYPEDTFYFIMGADSLYYFDKWKNPETIVRYASILAAPRNESSILQLQERIEELNGLFGKEHFFLIDCPEIPCSSSEIRKKLCQMREKTDSESAAEELYLPFSVYHYILEHSLYL